MQYGYFQRLLASDESWGTWLPEEWHMIWIGRTSGAIESMSLAIRLSKS